MNQTTATQSVADSSTDRRTRQRDVDKFIIAMFECCVHEMADEVAELSTEMLITVRDRCIFKFGEKLAYAAMAGYKVFNLTMLIDAADHDGESLEDYYSDLHSLTWACRVELGERGIGLYQDFTLEDIFVPNPHNDDEAFEAHQNARTLEIVH